MSDRGYTLIELSVVVLLISLIMLMAVPRIRDTLLNDDLKTAGRRIIGISRELRNEAVREQVDYILHIDLDNPRFWFCSADTTGEERANIRQKATRFPEGIRIPGVRHAGGVRKTEGEASVRFFHQGYVEPTVIHIEEDDRALTLVLDPFLRSVRVYEERIDYVFNEDDRAAGF